MAFVVNVGIPFLQVKLFLNSTIGLQNPKHRKETLKKGLTKYFCFPLVNEPGLFIKKTEGVYQQLKINWLINAAKIELTSKLYRIECPKSTWILPPTPRGVVCFTLIYFERIELFIPLPNLF